MPSVVVFEVTGQLQGAIEQLKPLVPGSIPLDAHPYRRLKRGMSYLALFVDQSAGPASVSIHAIGRVLPGDRSGASNRNLEFDYCYRLESPVPVPPPTRFGGGIWNADVVKAEANRTPLPPHAGTELLTMVASAGPGAEQAVEDLVQRLAPRVIDGNAGFVLACERDAVVLALKAANLHKEISALSDWRAGSPDEPFVAGLAMTAEQEQRRSDDEAGAFGSVPYFDARTSRVHVSRSIGYGPSVSLINLRPRRGGTPDGVDLVYLHPRDGALAVLRYTEAKTWPGSYQMQISSGIGFAHAAVLDPLRELDESFTSTVNPNDPRMVASACFVKFAGHKSFDPDANALIAGNIHVAADLRAPAPRLDDPFTSDRHLNNSTFAALLGAGWLGARAADERLLFATARKLVANNRAVLIAIQDYD